MDKTLKRQVVMVDKDFDKISYEDPGGSKGTFHAFTFETGGAHAPYNEGYGQNLTTVRETEKEKVPLIGPRQTITIEQTKSLPGDPVKIAFTTLQTRKDQYGMIFAMRFPNDTDKALNSYSVFTSDGSVDTAHSIKSLGDLTVNGVTYTYYLAKINSDTQARTELTVQFNFVAAQLMNGRMVLDIYEGFTFEHFSDSDYASADLTTHINFPHQKDFDKHKFQDVMSGDVLLAGTKRADGTVKAGESLRLGAINLRGALPFTMTVILPYNALSKSTWSVARNSIDTGYPSPVFPCHGTGRITIRLFTHFFDNDAAIPTSNFTLEYRIIAYRETGSSSLSRDFNTFAAVDYTDADIKRCGDVFYLNRGFTYDPPSDCIGYALEMKQVKPGTSLGNESTLICLLTQTI